MAPILRVCDDIENGYVHAHTHQHTYTHTQHNRALCAHMQHTHTHTHTHIHTFLIAHHAMHVQAHMSHCTSCYARTSTHVSLHYSSYTQLTYSTHTYIYTHSKYDTTTGAMLALTHTCRMKLSKLHFNCVVCGTTATKHCSGCGDRFVTYCSLTCQTKHWKSGHKKACVAPDAGNKEDLKVFKKIVRKTLSEAMLQHMNEDKAKCGNPKCMHHSYNNLVNEYAPQLRACSQCRHVNYCSKPCQKAHWLIHKTDCHLQFNDGARIGRWKNQNHHVLATGSSRRNIHRTQASYTINTMERKSRGGSNDGLEIETTLRCCQTLYCCDQCSHHCSCLNTRIGVFQLFTIS
jgi:hypothetical protein